MSVRNRSRDISLIGFSDVLSLMRLEVIVLQLMYIQTSFRVFPAVRVSGNDHRGRLCDKRPLIVTPSSADASFCCMPGVCVSQLVTC